MTSVTLSSSLLDSFKFSFLITDLDVLLLLRASRPLLTMYVSPEWRQSDTGMKEYHAIFLEHLTVEELKMKLALKCDLEACDTYAIFK